MRLAETASADDVTILLIKHPFDTTALLLITGNTSREVNWNEDETAHCKIHNVNVLRLNNNFYLTLTCDIKKAWAKSEKKIIVMLMDVKKKAPFYHAWLCVNKNKIWLRYFNGSFIL